MAKGRVAPLRPLTIVRLELQGAVTGCRLAITVSEELDIPLEWFTFWTDSETVLKYLKSRTGRFQTFVANRVAEILEKVTPAQWRHVPGRLNPADDVSRGLRPAQLTQDHRWFTGPEFLSRPEKEWPEDVTAAEPDDDEVVKAKVVLATTTPTQCVIFDLFKRTQDWTKARRVIALILRLKKRRLIRPKTSWLTGAEMRQAEVVCLRQAQRYYFKTELEALKRKKPIPTSSRLRFLAPELDENQLLRLNSRLKNSELSFDARQPVILPYEHPIATAIIAFVHDYRQHASTEGTLCEVLQFFWILRGRALVQRFVDKCFECRKKRAKPQTQLMAPLPTARLKPFEHPFSQTGIDYFGPMLVTQFRRSLKRYGCLFTCMSTRAVHIEIVPSLDTESFLMAFWRFSYRRGRPTNCWSDNATYFVTSDKELANAISEWNHAKIANQLNQHGITWHYSPPYGPHHGGAWESLIKSAKRALKTVLKNRSLTEETLATALVEVEALLNSRPLTHLSVDPKDLTPLTPNHFLIGRASPNAPVPLVNDAYLPPRKRWRLAQQLINHFWKRWLKEYLPTLHTRQKWTEARPNITVNSLVLLVDESLPRGKWPLGRILDVFPGPDGLVRSVLVKTASGEYTRPITRICLVEEAEPETKSQE